MAVASTMSQDDDNNNNINNNNKDDEHEHDMVMPGFRFHPTEEELIEFYLRRKVEGKRFNVELITFLDLYRYDPWELPALAAIGEKEWFFYVPRDRKYRNGDRPNRVTTSGYWKATGADRMIRTENFRSIGLKKTLVFYSGKAPKGIRTSWIMNEYRLPQHETERLQKAEISLCRVYKRAGVEDHPSLPRSLPTRGASSSSSTRGGIHHASTSTNITKKAINESISTSNTSLESNFQAAAYGSGNPVVQQMEEKLSETSGSSSTDHIGTSLGLLSKHNNTFISLAPMTTTTLSMEDPDHNDHDPVFLHHHHHHQPKQPCSSSTTTTLAPESNTIFVGSSSFVPTNTTIDDLHRLVNFHHHQQQQYYSINNIPNHSSQLFSSLQPPPVPPPLPPSSSSSSLALNNMIPGSLQAAFTDRLWDWSSINNEGTKDFNSSFK